MVNEKIIEFENSIVLIFNSSDLPLEVKRLVLKDILGQLDSVRIRILEQMASKKKGGEEVEQGIQQNQ